jgi:hypothetical protein
MSWGFYFVSTHYGDCILLFPVAQSVKQDTDYSPFLFIGE